MGNQINLISVSGGKDSTALLLWALEQKSEPLAVFADTGHEHLLTLEYLNYLETQIGVKILRVKADFSDRLAKRREFIRAKWPELGISQQRIDGACDALQPTGIPMLDLFLLKGRFPSARARFCTQELKVFPITEQVVMPRLDAGESVWSWQGVRADESRSRAKLTELEVVGGGLWIYRPLLQWTVESVFAMHWRHRIEPNPLYKRGMTRVGCMPCVMAKKGDIAAMAYFFPEEGERIEDWEQRVSAASRQGISTWFPSDVIPEGRQADEEALKTTAIATIKRVMEWSLTEYGGRQYGLKFDEPQQCQSAYGLCE